MIDCLRSLLFGQVKGRCLLGCPRSSFNDVAVRDCQLRRILHLTRMLRTDCCVSRTYVAHMSWKAILLSLLVMLYQL